jgi:hypothetical protein
LFVDPDEILSLLQKDVILIFDETLAVYLLYSLFCISDSNKYLFKKCQREVQNYTRSLV